MRLKDQKQNHTSSYYAATANWQTDYPELEGGHSADICVVGGGFTGVATALTMAERGYSVALVEANRVSWGASGRNGGQLIHGFSSDQKIASKLDDRNRKLLYDTIWRGNDIVLERIEKYGIDCDFKNGFLEVAAKSNHMRHFEEQKKFLDESGHPYEYRLMDREATREATGTDAYFGGLLTMRNGHLHPLNLCIGEARAAENLGAKFFEQSPVTRIEHGPRPRVVTEKGYVEASSVVLAGNAYHLLEQKHLGGKIFPAGSYIIATEPLSEELLDTTNPGDYAITDSKEIVGYYRLSADGRMLFGGACNYSGRDPKSIKSFIQPEMLKIYPQLKGVRIDYEWGGMIGIVPNRVPLIGRINENVYFAQGYSGHGVNATHIMGEIFLMPFAERWSDLICFQGSNTPAFPEADGSVTR
jgi:glycine/D-amino acid oxidase-like deaminating enzyme